MANYPRELNLGENVRSRLISYLDEILLAHDAERQGALNDIMGWQRDYWATPANQTNDYPFQGACNIVVPINAINVEAIYARAMTTLNALPEMVAAKIKSPMLQAAERPLEQFIDSDLKNRVRFNKAIASPVLEIIKLGTGVGYSTYERVTRNVVRDIGGEETLYQVTVKEGAIIKGVPVARFLYPFNATSLDNAPWLGEEHTATPYELRLYEDSGLFKRGTMETLEAYLYNSAAMANGGHQNDMYQADMENRRPVWPKELHWQEIWLAFDVNNDLIDEEIVVHYHKESRTLMSVRYNWHEDLRRKYRLGVYFPVENRIAGIGVGKQVEQFMAEITTQHRQMIDAGTIANTPMLKVSKLSGYGPGEPIYPGKMWFLDDMSHLDAIKPPDIYQSSFGNQQNTVNFMQQRTGIHDVTLGMPQSGTPGTATDTLSRVREGSNKSDYTYSNIKSFLDELVMDYVCDTAQFGARSLEIYDSPESQLVKQVLSLSPTDLRTGLILELRTSGQKDNKLQDRQDWSALAPQIIQYYSSLLQLAQVRQDPMLVAAIADQGMLAASEAMKQILQTFDVRNLDRIIFDPAKHAAGSNTGNSQFAIPPGGSPAGSSGIGADPRLSGIAALLGGGAG